MRNAGSLDGMVYCVVDFYSAIASASLDLLERNLVESNIAFVDVGDGRICDLIYNILRFS
jgi:hypothetical protein